MSEPAESSVPPPIVALAQWLVPGAGYWIIGQRARGVTVGVTVLVLFILGLIIGGMRVIDMPTSLGDNPVTAIFQKPWFMGQVLAGPISIVSAMIGNEKAGYVLSHARVNEIGTLYTAVAGMLNLLAIIDSAYRSARQEGGE